MAPSDSRGASSPTFDTRAAIQELISGREVAARLGALLRRSSAGGGAAEDESGELAEKVMMSFSRALAVLDSGGSSEARRGPAAAGESSLCSDDGKSEASTGKRKIRPAGDRRGQRRRLHSYAWTVTTKTLDDGHTWRKYGQKDIHSAKFPRSYFRCTHKYDQGCQATRQVQKTEDDSSVFHITYMGHHTCTNLTKSGRLGAGESVLISFGAPEEPMDVGAAGGSDWPAAAHPASKQECVDEDARSTLSRNDSSSEHLMPPQLPAKGTSTAALAAAGASGAAASDVGDATSGLQSSCMCPGGGGLDVDPAVDSWLRFEDVLDCDQDFDFFTKFDEGF